jgi:tetratricopeptide (TPR) repeat protein
MSRKSNKQAVPEKAAAAPSGAAGLNDRWTVPGICIFLAAIVWAVFGQTLGYGFVNFDDDIYVYDNPEVAQGLTLKGIASAFSCGHTDNWVPLTTISHMLDSQFYGLNAGGHHLTNILLHTVTAILLFLVLRQMTGALWRSAFVAAVFAVHPLRVESVAWVAERKDVLGGVFFMLTIGAYVRYARRPWSTVRYGLVLLLFALCLMSKPTVVTLPFVLLLLDYWPLNRFLLSAPAHTGAGIVWRLENFSVPLRLIAEKIPMLMFSFASCILTVLAERGGIQSVEKFPLHLRIENALVSYAVHVERMFYPAKLAVLYPYPVNGLPLLEIILAFLLLAAISLGVFFWRRKYACLLVGWLWYLGMFVPMIGLIQVGLQAQADHHTYLPQIGLYLLLTWAAADLCAGWRHRRAIMGICTMIILAALIFRAHTQTAYWRNGETLWAHTLACTSDNFVGHHGLGQALFEMGREDEAIAHYQQALQINPGYAVAHYNLGIALFRKGKVDEAIAHYQQALQIKPDYAEAHNNLGGVLLQEGDVDEAIAHLQKALQINPNNAEAHYNLGCALIRKNNADEAITEFQKALQIKPDYAEACYNLGIVLLQKGRADEAITQFQKVLQTKPDYADACYNFGIALSQKGRADEAITQFQKVLQINPDDTDALYNLGSVLFQKGDVDEAIAQFQKVLQIDRGYARVHNDLGGALLQKGKVDEAILQFQEALQINPDDLKAQNNLSWILATASQASLRNGNQAVELAQRANQLAGGENPIILHTLAAACAEAGRFDDAKRSAQKAMYLAQAAGQSNLVEQLNDELKLYNAGLPFHQESK